MAKSFSFNKRQKEKSKLKKKLEKQKRKDLRKSQGKSSMDDMIAYEDEYGRLHSSPSDIVKDEVKLEDIEVSIPKKTAEEEEREASLTGKVSYLNVEKGYGFIQQENVRNSYYFRLNNAPDEIEIEDKVSFKTEDSARGKNAINIVIVSR
jgi:cold shock CspA family protein